MNFNFGKDLLSDFLGCANLLWSSHTIRQRGFAANCMGVGALDQEKFKAEKIPSEDGNAVVPVDISSHLIYQKIQKCLTLNFTSLNRPDKLTKEQSFQFEQWNKLLRIVQLR